MDGDRHPSVGLDDVVHQRNRLGLLALLCGGDRVEFGYLREQLDLTAGNLSRHLSVLEGAALVTIEKGYLGRRPRTWVQITKLGRTAFQAEVETLRAVLDAAGVRGS